MNITISGVDITLTLDQIKKLQAKLPPQKITDRIQSLSDVYDIIGVDRDRVIPYAAPHTKLQIAANAFVDLNNITQAYNEGWTPDFTNTSQPKYYLYFERKPGARGGWVVYCCSGYVCSLANGGFSLYFETREKALDAGKKFINVFNDFLPC